MGQHDFTDDDANDYFLLLFLRCLIEVFYVLELCLYLYLYMYFGGYQ